MPTYGHHLMRFQYPWTQHWEYRNSRKESRNRTTLLLKLMMISSPVGSLWKWRTGLCWTHRKSKNRTPQILPLVQARIRQKIPLWALCRSMLSPAVFPQLDFTVRPRVLAIQIHTKKPQNCTTIWGMEIWEMPIQAPMLKKISSFVRVLKISRIQRWVPRRD